MLYIADRTSEALTGIIWSSDTLIKNLHFRLNFRTIHFQFILKLWRCSILWYRRIKIMLQKLIFTVFCFLWIYQINMFKIQIQTTMGYRNKYTLIHSYSDGVLEGTNERDLSHNTCLYIIVLSLVHMVCLFQRHL